MAKYTGPVCRFCRREGLKLFLKGERCLSERCAYERRNYAPGQHGQHRSKLSDYGLQMREKQKVRRVYGMQEKQFRDFFDKVKNDDSITGIMFQQPLSKELSELIDVINPYKDIEGVGSNNMGKLFVGKDDAIIPCTSKAVMEVFDFYNIDLDGKKVVVVGRSNIVGKPLIPQLLQKNATITICHSKTKNLKEETKNADVVIMAIGKPRFLKKEDIKDGAILIDVGINFENGKIVGDIDFEDVKDKASMCTPVPGGIGTITNAVLIDNIMKSCEKI